jgi:hypothetical protein
MVAFNVGLHSILFGNVDHATLESDMRTLLAVAIFAGGIVAVGPPADTAKKYKRSPERHHYGPHYYAPRYSREEVECDRAGIRGLCGNRVARHRRAFVRFASSVPSHGRAFWQEFPSHSPKFVVPFPAGGPADIMSRIVDQAPPAQESLGRGRHDRTLRRVCR